MKRRRVVERKGKTKREKEAESQIDRQRNRHTKRKRKIGKKERRKEGKKEGKKEEGKKERVSEVSEQAHEWSVVEHCGASEQFQRMNIPSEHSKASVAKPVCGVSEARERTQRATRTSDFFKTRLSRVETESGQPSAGKREKKKERKKERK